MARLRTSALVTVGSQATMLVVTFVKMAVISRLLTPSEIGAFALASSLFVMARVLRVFGTWEYIVAQSELTEEKLRACFTLLMIISMAITGLYVFSAPAIATYLDSPELAWLIPMMSSSFIILSIALVGQALMSREMRFGQLSIARIAAGFSDAAVTLTLVWFGYGVMSMAWGFVVAAIASTACVIAFTPGRILYRPYFRGMKDIIQFGWIASLGGWLGSVGDFGPTLVLGRALDSAAVGYYGRGQTLVTVFRQGLETTTGPVIQTWFAAKSRNNPKEMAESYLMINSIVSAVTWPAYMFVIFNAATLVPILLGPQWDQSIPIAQALAVGAMFSTFSAYGMNLLAGRGNVKRRLLFNMIAQTFRFGLLFLVVGYGLQAFAWSLAVSHIFAFFLMGLFLRREIGLPVSDLVLSLKLSALTTLPIVGLNYAAQSLWSTDGRLEIPHFIAVILACMVVWVITLAALRHPLWFQILQILKIDRFSDKK